MPLHLQRWHSVVTVVIPRAEGGYANPITDKAVQCALPHAAACNVNKQGVELPQ